MKEKCKQCKYMYYTLSGEIACQLKVCKDVKQKENN